MKRKKKISSYIAKENNTKQFNQGKQNRWVRITSRFTIKNNIFYFFTNGIFKQFVCDYEHGIKIQVILEEHKKHTLTQTKS